MTETSDYTGILIPASIHQEPSIHQGLTFDEMKGLMGIELAQVHYTSDQNTYTLWADEEGLFAPNPVQNYRATALLHSEANLYHPAVGPVFISGGAKDGITQPLEATVMGQLMQKLTGGKSEIFEQVRALNNIAAGVRNP